MATLRMAGVVKESIVDGPGIRYVVFVQGCPHHCPGCHNPQSHDFAGGADCEVEDILAELDRDPLLSGVTFSGGEPFCQAQALCELAHGVRERGLGLMAYSGYTYEELSEMGRRDPAVDELLGLCDHLVDGRFVLVERDLTLQFRGSRNQRIVDVAATRAAGVVVPVEL